MRKTWLAAVRLSLINSRQSDSSAALCALTVGICEDYPFAPQRSDMSMTLMLGSPTKDSSDCWRCLGASVPSTRVWTRLTSVRAVETRSRVVVQKENMMLVILLVGQDLVCKYDLLPLVRLWYR